MLELFAFVSASFFEAESGCKDKTFFRTFQIFFKKNFKSFQGSFRAESAAKITHFRIPSKSFGRFFRTNFSENLVAFQNTFRFLIAGAKIRHSVGYFQTFPKLFSILIFILPSHRYPTSSYDFPFPAEISIYNKVRVYRPIPKQNRRCMRRTSVLYPDSNGTPTLFPESEGQTHA